MGCWVAFAVNKGEAAVYVLQLHQYHGTGAIVAATRDEPFAMAVHNHEHAACLVGYDFAIVTCSVQDGFWTLGCQYRLRLTPTRKELLGGAQTQRVFVIVEVVLGAVEVVEALVFVDVATFVCRSDVVRLATFGIVDAILGQFADVVALAVHIAIDKIVAAIIVEEILSVLRRGMLGRSHVQGVHIAEGAVYVVCHTNHLAVVLHRDKQGQIHHQLALDECRAGCPIVDVLVDGTCVHGVEVAVAVWVVRSGTWEHVTIISPVAEVLTAVNLDGIACFEAVEPPVYLHNRGVGAVEVRHRVHGKGLVRHVFAECGVFAEVQQHLLAYYVLWVLGNGIQICQTGEDGGKQTDFCLRRQVKHGRYVLLEFHHAKGIDEQVLQFANGLLGKADQDVLTWGQWLKRLANESITFGLDIEIAEFQTRIFIL